MRNGDLPVNSRADHDGQQLTAAPEDRELVRTFIRLREEKVFRALYRAHTPTLYRFVLRLVHGDDRDAEEVVQLTWVRAVERLGDFRWESTLRSWLAGIALNCSRELYRQRRRRAQTEPLESWELAAPSGIGADARRIDLERAIARLPDGYREVLILHDIEGYTHTEIGQALGIDPGTSKSQLSRARRAVRDLLGSDRHGASAGHRAPPAQVARSREIT